MAYAQQAAFTLELALKAYLEVLGKLAMPNIGDFQKWHKHELADLFKLLTTAEKKQLEEWWDRSDTKRSHFKGSFRDFVSASSKLYLKWRYITELRFPDLSIDIPMLLSASGFLLHASDRVFKDSSPIKVNITMTTNPGSVNGDGHPVPKFVTTLVKGRVRELRIPDGFDPFSIVELVIDSDQHGYEIVAQFYKRNVKDYHGLEGKRVTLVGRVREDRPHLLPHPSHLDEPRRQSIYSSERRSLKGSVHDIRVVHSAHGGPGKIDLSLWDETFVTQVECFFVTEEERDRLKNINLGDKVVITGHATLLNGIPILLVGPDRIELLTEDPEG